MGLFRDLGQQLREGWLILTGRHQQAMDEADARAKQDVEVECERARLRPDYDSYRNAIYRWRDAFEILVSKMEEEGAHRKIVFTDRDFEELPKVMAPEHVDDPYEGYVMLNLFVKTQEWRARRIEELKARLGSQR